MYMDCIVIAVYLHLYNLHLLSIRLGYLVTSKSTLLQNNAYI